MEVTVTTTSKATLSKTELYRICEKQIQDAACWVDNNYISDGNLMLKEEYRSSHSWTEHLFIRVATPLDLATDMILQKLRDQLLA
jgi:hypothetical protein